MEARFIVLFRTFFYAMVGGVFWIVSGIELLTPSIGFAFQIVSLFAFLLALHWLHSTTRPRLKIIKATYGVGPKTIDVTAQVRKLVIDGRLECTIGNDWGDPAPGDQGKVFNITFTLEDEHISKTIVEGGFVFIE